MRVVVSENLESEKIVEKDVAWTVELEEQALEQASLPRCALLNSEA